MKSLKDYLPGMVVKPAHVHEYTKHIGFRVHVKSMAKYILARQCDCGKYKAYDLVDELPSRRVQQ